MQIYETNEVAAMLRLSVKTVRQYLASGKLVGRKVGKRWLVTEEALRRFLMDGEAEEGVRPGRFTFASDPGRSPRASKSKSSRPDTGLPKHK